MMVRSGEEIGPKVCPCVCIPQRVTARASSSESLQGARASVKKGPAGLTARVWYNALQCLQRRGGRAGGRVEAGGLGTYSGVLIPTCENMWGRCTHLHVVVVLSNPCVMFVMHPLCIQPLASLMHRLMG